MSVDLALEHKFHLWHPWENLFWNRRLSDKNFSPQTFFYWARRNKSRQKTLLEFVVCNQTTVWELTSLRCSQAKARTSTPCCHPWWLQGLSGGSKRITVCLACDEKSEHQLDRNEQHGDHHSSGCKSGLSTPNLFVWLQDLVEILFASARVSLGPFVWENIKTWQ